jgi:putative membrane protein
MKTASGLFTESERRKVAEAVTAAEKNTSGEIVPVVATASGRYDRAEDLVGLLFGLILMGLAWVVDFGALVADWGTVERTGPCWVTAAIFMLIGFVAGSVIASHVAPLRRLFTPTEEMRQEVIARADAAFHTYRIRNTAEATGVLIYVSLYERMVRVVGDDAIAAKVDQPRWDDICNTVVRGMIDGRPGDGLAEGVMKAGELLADHFPSAETDTDELPNELHLID